MRRATRTASWISGHRRNHLTVVAHIGPLPFEELLPACMVLFAVVVPALRAGWRSRRSGHAGSRSDSRATDLLKRALFRSPSKPSSIGGPFGHRRRAERHAPTDASSGVKGGVLVEACETLGMDESRASDSSIRALLLRAKSRSRTRPAGGQGVGKATPTNSRGANDR